MAEPVINQHHFKGILYSTIIALIFVCFALLVESDEALISGKDPELSAEDRKVFEGKLSELEQILEIAENDDQKFNAYLRQGHYLFALGKYQHARRKFSLAADLKPEEHSAYAALYEVQMAMNDNLGAKESINKAISLRADIADNWRKLITLEKERNNAGSDRLNGLYIDALRETHSDINIITAYAAFLESIDNLQAAKEYWQLAITQNPAGKVLYDAEIMRIDGLLKERGLQ
jgi:tetratricopeptide (TPR) repeat protein